MDSQKGKRASRVERALSWIAGSDSGPFVSDHHASNTTNEGPNESNTRNRIRKRDKGRRPNSLYSFLATHTVSGTKYETSSGNLQNTKMGLDSGHGVVVEKGMDVHLSSITASPTSSMRSWTAIRGGQASGSGAALAREGPTGRSGNAVCRPEHAGDARPPPFFYSRPLSTLLDRMTVGVTHGEDVSVSSVDSREISRWKRGKGKRASDPGTPGLRGRFGSLKSLLSPGSRIISADHQSEEVQTYTPGTQDVSLAVSTPIVPATPLPIYNHPFSTPDLTVASRSYTHSRSASTISQGLSPPPRPKRRQSQRWTAPKNFSQSIDPAKWAEISISAAELVNHFGEGNVLFYPSPPSISTESDSFETERNSFDGNEAVGDATFIELEDQCTPLRLSASRTIQDRDLDVSRSSMATESMISFSKWPLPPQCDRFDVASAL